MSYCIVASKPYYLEYMYPLAEVQSVYQFNYGLDTVMMKLSLYLNH